MKKNIAVSLIIFLYCVFLGAQPLTRPLPPRHVHHTHRLPGVNEHRLARLEKMREANITRRHQTSLLRAKTQPETQRGLVLLVEFPDMKMKDGAATQWNNRFNQEGFSFDRHIGSVRDYFIEQSYGLLTIDFDVIGPLMLTQIHDYYGSAPNSRLDDRAAEMVIEALQLANPQVNYADYDWDGDGEMDQVYIIFAGKTSDTEEGYIWPHEWYLSGAHYYGNGSGRQRLDNVYIDTYAVSNELADSITLEGIGTACHEFSHCLGFPDYYDTYYLGGTAGQFWDLMDGGSYNGPLKIGEVPCPYTAYERWSAGWIDLIPLTESCKVAEMPAINEEGVAYVINNTGNKNEYYILENRQRISFGTGNYGHGLMVWHIDYNYSIWQDNEVNADKNHQRMTFLPADGSVGELVYDEERDMYYYEVPVEDEAGDPYPGRENVTSVQQLTWFTKERNGTKIHKNLIHNISETPGGKISFIYGDYIALPTPEIAAPTNISEYSFTANWLPVDGAVSYTLEVEAMTGEEAPATILSEDFSNFQSISADASITNSIVNNYTQTKGWEVSKLYGTRDASVRVGAAGAIGYLMTPLLENKIGTLIVEFDAAYYESDGSNIVVSVLNSDLVVATKTIPLTDNRTTYSLTFENIPSGCSIKFASEASRKRFYLYNVNIMDMSGVGSRVMTHTDLITTSYTIETLDADMYYYRVQAVCSDGTSEWSEWMDVDIASAMDEVPIFPSFGEGRSEVYDLMGRHLQRIPQRGFYILDGKKYILR